MLRATKWSQDNAGLVCAWVRQHVVPVRVIETAPVAANIVIENTGAFVIESVQAGKPVLTPTSLKTKPVVAVVVRAPISDA